jgi:hypothetical protein
VEGRQQASSRLSAGGLHSSSSAIFDGDNNHTTVTVGLEQVFFDFFYSVL